MDATMPRLGRRRFLEVGAAGAVALTTLPAAAQGGAVRWVGPRGTVEVLDDYPYWVAQRLGYFGDLATTLDPGPMRAGAPAELVDRDEADMGAPSPAAFAVALDAGVPLASVFHLGAHDVFGFAFPAGRKPRSAQGLAGKTIVLGSLAWRPICDLELAQLGVDPASVAYAEAGQQWAQALLQGRGDAALCWEGLRAQWAGQGLPLDYLLPYEFSRLPSNTFVVRRADLDDPWRRPVYERYLRGWAMGLEFAHLNPRAATQIVMERFPALAGALTPEVATASLMQLAKVYRGPWEYRQSWGWHDTGQWQFFFDLIRRVGQVGRPIRAGDVCRNDYVEAANRFESPKLAMDATAFQLAPKATGIKVDP